MTVVRIIHDCDNAALEALREPRDDFVSEVTVGDDRWELGHGPFREYRRELSVRSSSSQDAPDYASENLVTTSNSNDALQSSQRRWNVTETITYRLAIPMWGWLFKFPAQRALRHRKSHYGYWWAPPDRLDTRMAMVLGVLCAVQVVDGYLGSVLSQTLTYAADEFERGNTAQGVVLGVVRLGVLVALGTLAMADRRGRRSLLVATGIGSCIFTVLGGLSPNMWLLGGSQLLARGLSTALGVLIAVVATEEMPARSRAWAASFLILSAGLGSGIAVWILPVADLSFRGWRTIYLAAGFGILLLCWAARRLPETRRFSAHQKRTTPLAQTDRRRRRNRLILLAVSAFLIAVFVAPSAGFQNDFLKDERGFTATGITLFTIVTATPIGIGVLVGGHLAETQGRRRVGAFGLVCGSVLRAMSFFVSGPALWLLTVASVVSGAIAVPALAVYGPELFGTHDRGRANGLIITVGVLGSAVGLLSVGVLSDRWGGELALPIALTAIGPLIVAILVLLRFPETAGRELEELNPQDA